MYGGESIRKQPSFYYQLAHPTITIATDQFKSIQKRPFPPYGLMIKLCPLMAAILTGGRDQQTHLSKIIREMFNWLTGAIGNRGIHCSACCYKKGLVNMKTNYSVI